MNACTTIETESAPFEIGQGFANRNGRAWIVAIEPVDTQGGLIRRQMLLIGGPSPMAEIRWNVQTVSDTGQISMHDEHTIGRLVAQYPIPVCWPWGTRKALEPNPIRFARADREARAGNETMAYQRKTRDEWELQGNYGQGWECLTTEESHAAAVDQRKCYQENEGGLYRIVCRRVPLANINGESGQ